MVSRVITELLTSLVGIVYHVKHSVCVSVSICPENNF